jgi:hypothetical protein
MICFPVASAMLFLIEQAYFSSFVDTVDKHPSLFNLVDLQSFGAGKVELRKSCGESKVAGSSCESHVSAHSVEKSPWYAIAPGGFGFMKMLDAYPNMPKSWNPVPENRNSEVRKWCVTACQARISWNSGRLYLLPGLS